MPYTVAEVFIESDAHKLVAAGKKAFIGGTKYYGYLDDATEVLPLDTFQSVEISDKRNETLGEITYDSVNNAWPIIRPRKMFPR